MRARPSQGSPRYTTIRPVWLLWSHEALTGACFARYYPARLSPRAGA